MCRVLELQDTASALRGVPEKHKARKSLGLRGQHPYLVSESGLYRLVMRSHKKEAEDFQEWVTSEVLPAIRRNGGYMTPEVAQAAIDDPAVFMAKALVMANDTITRLKPQARGMDPINPPYSDDRSASRWGSK